MIFWIFRTAFQNLCVGYFVLPLDAQNTPQAPQMKAVEFLLMPHVSGPCLTTIEECAEHTGLVDAQLDLHCKVVVAPDPLVQSGHDRYCLGDSAIYLHIYGKRAGDSRPEVGEVLNNFQVVPINGDGWRGAFFLGHDVGFFQADSQSKLIAGVGEATDKLLQAIYSMGCQGCVIGKEHLTD